MLKTGNPTATHLSFINWDSRGRIDEGTEPRHNCHGSYLLLQSPSEDKESIGPNLGVSFSNWILKKKTHPKKQTKTSHNHKEKTY